MTRYANWLHETFGTGLGRPAAGAAGGRMEPLEPRLLLSGLTSQGSGAVNITPIPGDTNCDGAVNVIDLGVLAKHYGTAATGYSNGDFNNDGQVDVIDLGVLARYYGTTLGNFGDVNNDGTVDVIDLGVLARNYGTAAKGCANGDFNNDGEVNVIDLGVLAASYGRVLAPPMITVNSLTSALASPALTGTVRDSYATITVMVDSTVYAAVSNGDSTWTLPAGTIDPLETGIHNVVATAFDTAGNIGTATTTLAIETSYQDLVGTPPNPATLAFADWCNDLLAARLGQIAAPTATYYFAATGDDATGDGSMAHPWQSIAKANTMLTGDGVQCLFNRGNEWPTTVGLDLSGNNTSVGCYGDPSKPKPLIHCFTHTIPTSAAWTQVHGTSDYTYALSASGTAIAVAGTGTLGGVSVDGIYYPVGTYNGQTTYQNPTNGFWFWNTTTWTNLWMLTDSTPGQNPTNAWYTIGGTAAGYYASVSSTGSASSGSLGLRVGWLSPAWIRDKARRFDAYAWMGTAEAITAGSDQPPAIAAAISLVQNTPYSWFYDPTTCLLHMNAGGASPATINWEWSDTTAVADDGIDIERSGYAFGLRADGWGCGPVLGGILNQEWCIKATGGVGTRAVVDGCEAYYGGRHIIGATGIGYNAFTVIGCAAGYTNTTDESGSSTYVGYSTDGANETILWNSACRFGDLPWSGSPLSGWTQANAIITHAGGATYYNIGLDLVWGLTVTGEPCWHNATWGNGSLGFVNDCLPGNSNDIATLRAWAIGCSYDVPSAPYCGNGTSEKSVSINCCQRVVLTPAAAIGTVRGIYGNFGWSINESIDIVDPDGGSTGIRYLAMLGKTINQSVRVTCANPAEIVMIDRDAGDFGLPAGTLLNCEFSVVGAAGASAILVPTANCSHDAYSGLADFRSGTEVGELGLVSAIDPLAIPYPGSALYDAGTSTVAVLGTPLEYDINWNRRPANSPSIGAVEGDRTGADSALAMNTPDSSYSC